MMSDKSHVNAVRHVACYGMQTGDVVRLGQHRLMCGDAGNPEHVAALFDGVKPDLVFTSPPYLNQRDYDGHIAPCWDTMMRRVFGAMPWHEKTQVLVNLGLVHRKGEWLPYWDAWIAWMRTQGWRRFGLYVWDKKEPLPGCFNGRLAPRFEFIFHFNKKHRLPNKTVPCKWHNKDVCRGRNPITRRSRNFGMTHHGRPIQPFKIAPDVIETKREKSNASLGHPAKFPLALPASVHASYSDVGALIYDPFCGSGTSILAAEQTGRICYAMEINPNYCQIAIDRCTAPLL